MFDMDFLQFAFYFFIDQVSQSNLKKFKTDDLELWFLLSDLRASSTDSAAVQVVATVYSGVSSKSWKS